jgi:hypothetical protein
MGYGNKAAEEDDSRECKKYRSLSEIGIAIFPIFETPKLFQDDPSPSSRPLYRVEY